MLARFSKHAASRHRQPGFTLVETLIVVMIMGILAAVVLPQFGRANQDAQESALIQELQTLRSQIKAYQFDHGGSFPGQSAATSTAFRNALLLSSDAAGNTGPAGTLPFGPYLLNQIPPNPVNGAAGVMIVANIDTATPNPGATDGTAAVGWIYSPTQGRIKANSAGAAGDGTPLQNL